MKNILFVCTGNVCRSPMAEALFRELVRDRKDYEVRSAGVAAAAGCAASPETVEVLAARDIRLEGFGSRQVDADILDWATHIFTMTAGHLAALDGLIPSAADRAFLVTEFSRDDTLRSHDVPDPIGMGPPAYEETYHTLNTVLPDVLEFIEQTTARTQS